MSGLNSLCHRATPFLRWPVNLSLGLVLASSPLGPPIPVPLPRARGESVGRKFENGRRAIVTISQTQARLRYQPVWWSSVLRRIGDFGPALNEAAW